MQVIINWHENIDFTATIDIDPNAVRTYWQEDSGWAIDGNIADWMIRGYLRDQQEVWLEQVSIKGATDRISDTTRTLGEINVIS